MPAPSTTAVLNNQDENVTACSQCNSATFPFQIELGGRVNVVDQQALASETVMIIRLLAHLWRWVGGWVVQVLINLQMLVVTAEAFWAYQRNHQRGGEADQRRGIC